MSKKFVLINLLVVVAMVLVACSPAATPPTAPCADHGPGCPGSCRGPAG